MSDLVARSLRERIDATLEGRYFGHLTASRLLAEAAQEIECWEILLRHALERAERAEAGRDRLQRQNDAQAERHDLTLSQRERARLARITELEAKVADYARLLVAAENDRDAFLAAANRRVETQNETTQ